MLFTLCNSPSPNLLDYVSPLLCRHASRPNGLYMAHFFRNSKTRIRSIVTLSILCCNVILAMFTCMYPCVSIYNMFYIILLIYSRPCMWYVLYVYMRVKVSRPLYPLRRQSEQLLILACKIPTANFKQLFLVVCLLFHFYSKVTLLNRPQFIGLHKEAHAHCSLLFTRTWTIWASLSNSSSNMR